MKNRFTNLRRGLALATLLAAVSLSAPAQSVGIGTTAPDASAALEVQSTTQGLLPPRLTAAQRAAIVAPAAGLQVFQVDGTPGVYVFSGAYWLNLTTGREPTLTGVGIVPNTGTFAGDYGTPSSPPTSGYSDLGRGLFSDPTGVAVDGRGQLYVADRGNQRIRQIDLATGAVSTLAGSGTAGFADGVGTAAAFSDPTGVAYGNGSVYVADRGNRRIRQIDLATGAVSTLAGSGASGTADGVGAAATFSGPTGVAYANGMVFVADNRLIRQVAVATGVVSTPAGSGTAGFADGVGAAARFNGAAGVAANANGSVVYVTDLGNRRIRKLVVATRTVTTLAGTGATGGLDGAGAVATFGTPMGVALANDGNIYVADRSSYSIRRVAMDTGAVSTLYQFDTRPANLQMPNGVAVDASGAAYVALAEHLIRMLK
ncbi:SMP-30/gluconolactonase/LRE family protein [Hymenobacter artigasi]|uniref:Sugar lactone lactonase YvrE n=1 Tax=Hymenobacter artigasi TaxID=2719616 RepID=A0ABX1HGT7_9BACT|nr:SMP-30/gluconolactonase/LRE family protein [Hymenobacter artigasi]NKI89265.1 sugar lactone lactonase YvrE [Hymenobacter artigasi]